MIYRRPENDQSKAGNIVRINNEEFPSDFGQITEVDEGFIEVAPIGDRRGVSLPAVEAAVKESLS